MKNSVLVILLCLLSLTMLSCSQEKETSAKVLARINDYELTLDEFQKQLAAEIQMDENFKLTESAKKQFLEGLITKELLIQEAKRQQLDRKEKFRSAIERYWESTLIKNLMEVQGKKIEERITVSENEIEARYRKMKEIDNSIPPFEKMRDNVSKKILEEKKSRILNGWIEDMKRKAGIKIDQQVLSSS